MARPQLIIMRGPGPFVFDGADGHPQQFDHRVVVGEVAAAPDDLVVTGPGTAGPLDTVQQREAVSFAVLLLLDRLSPTERAVFVLRSVFDYEYAELSEMFDITADHCRQLYSRARATWPRSGGGSRSAGRLTRT